MARQLPNRNPDLERRRQILIGGALGLLGLLELPLPRLADAAVKQYPKSIEALQKGVVAETAAHRRYVEFGQHANSEGYKGLAYLYTALATSELIHAQNYRRVLTTLGELVAEPEIAPVTVGTAKDNLIYAAEREMHSIENTYPSLLQSVESEGQATVIAAIRYSWSSHKQHLEIIEKIRRWSPSFFETVARKIDEKTDRYYVCEICGSTVTEIPVDGCPICGESAAGYRLIPPDRFF
jgi:rubrerythrin